MVVLPPASPRRARAEETVSTPSWPPIPGPEEVLQELGRLGAHLPGRRAGAHAVAEEEEELPVLPAEPQAGVPADLLPPAGGPGQAHRGPVGLGLGEEEAVSHRLPLPEAGAQGPGRAPAGRRGSSAPP